MQPPSTSVEVHWPSGAQKKSFTFANADHIVTITEGKGITATLCTSGACATTAKAEPSTK